MSSRKIWSRSITSLVLLSALLFTACMRTPEQKYADFMKSGLDFAKQQDYDRAILQFKNAIRAKPDDAEVHYQMALACLASGRWSELVAAIRTADRLDPRHLGIQLLMAQLSLQTGTPESVSEANERIQNVLAQSPENSDALFVMAATKERLGSLDEAETLLQDALRVSPQHISSSVALARVKLARKDVAGAEAVLRNAAAHDPDSPDTAVIIGQFYATLGRPDDAETQFRRALAADPRNAPALIGLAGLRTRAGRSEEAEQLYKEVALLPDKNYQPVYGQVLLQNGKFDEAIVEFTRLAKEYPTDRAMRSRLVAANIMANRPSEAEQILTEAFEKNPKDTDALLQRAEIYFRSGKFSEAQDDLTKVLEHRPTSFEGHYLLAGVHAARKAFLLERQELAEALRLNPSYLPARIDMARTLLASANPRAGLDMLAEAPEPQQRTLPFIIARNWAHLALGNRAEARQGIDQGLAAARLPELLLQDGLLLLTEGKHPQARACFEEVLRRQPDELRALRALAQSYVAAKQQSTATSIVRKHAEQHLSSPRAQYFLGDWYVRTGDRTLAREAFQRARTLDTSFAEAGLAIVRLDLAERKLPQARSGLAEILKQDATNTDARLLMALIAEAEHQPEEAIDQYLRVVAEQPENFVALNNLAYRFAAEHRDLDEALKFAQKAKEIAPDNASVDDTLGWVYYLKGVYSTALRHFQDAAARQPHDALIRYHLAMTYFQLGDMDAGRRALDEALRLDPDVPEAEMAQQLLAQAKGPR